MRLNIKSKYENRLSSNLAFIIVFRMLLLFYESNRITIEFNYLVIAKNVLLDIRIERLCLVYLHFDITIIRQNILVKDYAFFNNAVSLIKSKWNSCCKFQKPRRIFPGRNPRGVILQLLDKNMMWFIESGCNYFLWNITMCTLSDIRISMELLNIYIIDKFYQVKFYI